MTLPLRMFALLAALLAPAAAAHAQIAVLRIDPEAQAVCRDLEAALRGVGIVADPGYLNEAQAQGVDPTSDSALELITPLLGLKLAVVPMYVDDASIDVQYRDGRTGALLGETKLPRERGKLGARGREQLRHEVVSHLGAQLEGRAPSEAPAQPDELGAPQPEPEPEPGAPRSLQALLRAGLGIGMRDVDWTRDGEAQNIALGAFPAVDLGLTILLRLSDAISLAPAFTYQSSLFFQEVEEMKVAAPAEQTSVRAHRFAGTLGLELRLGGERGVALVPAVGVGVRNLRPEVHHLGTPAYSLAGPLAQLGVHIPLARTLALRLAPEAQYVFVGEGLRERGAEPTGLGLAVEAALALELIERLALELAYREAHALLSSTEGDAGDVERFITLRAVGKL